MSALAAEPRVTLDIAKAVERRFAAVTPWHVRVRVSVLDGGYAYRYWSLRWLNVRKGSGHGADASGKGAFWRLLSSLQSYISSKTKRCWPPSEPAPAEHWPEGLSKEEVRAFFVARDERFLEPGVAYGHGEIQLWYGAPDRPVLELDPIPVPES